MTNMLEIFSCSVFQNIIQAKGYQPTDNSRDELERHTAYTSVANGIIGHKVDFVYSSALCSESKVMLGRSLPI